jgi:hypothetical protein
MLSLGTWAGFIAWSVLPLEMYLLHRPAHFRLHMPEPLLGWAPVFAVRLGAVATAHAVLAAASAAHPFVAAGVVRHGFRGVEGVGVGVVDGIEDGVYFGAEFGEIEEPEDEPHYIPGD